jgi:hypothetical protein
LFVFIFIQNNNNIILNVPEEVLNETDAFGSHFEEDPWYDQAPLFRWDEYSKGAST